MQAVIVPHISGRELQATGQCDSDSDCSGRSDDLKSCNIKVRCATQSMHEGIDFQL